MAGVGLKTVQTLAGHKTISMTARYSHLAPNSLHAAVESLLKKKGQKTPTDTTTDTSGSKKK
jgi:site-specific recombinase XerD